ncbi:hypothetical protein [Streptomyces viridosporus]|uniref:hypothetical protein n=1 Tax=Streptomyces viridosporus TaxID=67581 RepID=UPI0021003B95|nr:hypothetical protein [Streptomyces viridosporus]
MLHVVGDIDDLVACHHRLTGPRRDPDTLPAGQHVLTAGHTDRQTTLLVRTDTAVHDPTWTIGPLGREDIVLAPMPGPRLDQNSAVSPRHSSPENFFARAGQARTC